MTRTTRPFLDSLQSLLKNRFPEDEYQQIMEESLWEYEQLLDASGGPPTLPTPGYSQYFFLCLSFYRAMLSVGMARHLAAKTIADASRSGDWSPAPFLTPESCSLAVYFHSQDAMDLCEAVYCSKCPSQPTCGDLTTLKARKSQY